MKIETVSSCILQGCILVACLVATPVLADRPLAIVADDDTHSPAVAHDPTRDRYLVVYQASFGRLVGQLRAGDGSVVDGYLSLLPSYPGVEYRNPRVTYKRHNDLWILVAIMEDRTLMLPRIVLTVSAFTADGDLAWTYDVPGVGNTVRTPDVMADTFPDDCCILVAWKESYGAIFARQIDADGNFVGSRTTIHPDGGRFSGHAFNPRIAYARLRDRFVVVYQRTYRGAHPRLELRALQPVSGGLGFHRSPIEFHEDPRTSYGGKSTGGPDIAWDDTARRFMVAWRDDIYLRGVLFDPDGWMASNPVNLFVDDEARGDRLAGGIPEVIAATGRDRFLVSHARSLDGVFDTERPAWWLEGWWMDLAGRVRRDPVSTWRYQEPAGASGGGWSPATDSAFVVWERDEFVSDIVASPPRDLYWEAGSPP